MGILGTLFKPMVMALRQPVESFIRLETADSDTVLVAEDGSLISYIKIDGARQIIGAEEYKKIIDQSVVKIGSRFDRAGHAMQLFFTRNPERIQEELRAFIRPNQMASKNIGLEIDDIFDERAKHLSKYLAWEEIYAVMWTRPTVMTKTELKREAEINRKKTWVKAGNAQNPLAKPAGAQI